MSIYRVWSKLDSIAHSVILTELGYFDQSTRAQRDKWARTVAAELKSHKWRLRKFLKLQVEHEYQIRRPPRFHQPNLYFGMELDGRATLRTVIEAEILNLERSQSRIYARLKARGKWDVRGIVRAQEYVKRRAEFLGLSKRFRLTPDAIADIYQLTHPSKNADNDDSDIAENIRKAIAYFRKDPKNEYLFKDPEYYLPNWKEPVSSPCLETRRP